MCVSVCASVSCTEFCKSHFVSFHSIVFVMLLNLFPSLCTSNFCLFGYCYKPIIFIVCLVFILIIAQHKPSGKFVRWQHLCLIARAGRRKGTMSYVRAGCKEQTLLMFYCLASYDYRIYPPLLSYFTPPLSGQILPSALHFANLQGIAYTEQRYNGREN